MTNSRNTQIVEESDKTKKAREKLKQQLDKQNEGVDEQALRRKKAEIERWIEHHATERVVLKAKSISLFDENQNAAEMSPKVQEIALELKKALSEEK